MLKDLLTGRLALVTGAGRGNGAAIARGLADAGAKVIVTDIDADAAHAVAESIVKAGGEARGYALDVADHEGCRKLAEDIALLIGPIRILVNNAGIFLRGNLLASDGRERWDKTMAVNVDGAFNVTSAFADQLRRTHGAVVNVASINSFTAPAGSGVYPVSKGAIAQFTRALGGRAGARRRAGERHRARHHRHRHGRADDRRSQAAGGFSHPCADEARRPARGTCRPGRVPLLRLGELRDRRHPGGRWRFSCRLKRHRCPRR